jgi:hypothetical protein
VLRNAYDKTGLAFDRVPLLSRHFQQLLPDLLHEIRDDVLVACNGRDAGLTLGDQFRR